MSVGSEHLTAYFMSLNTSKEIFLLRVPTVQTTLTLVEKKSIKFIFHFEPNPEHTILITTTLSRLFLIINITYKPSPVSATNIPRRMHTTYKNKPVAITCWFTSLNKIKNKKVAKTNAPMRELEERLAGQLDAAARARRAC